MSEVNKTDSDLLVIEELCQYFTPERVAAIQAPRRMYGYLTIVNPYKFVEGHMAAARQFVGKKRLQSYKQRLIDLKQALEQERGIS
jgi:hypothetical protein